MVQYPDRDNVSKGWWLPGSSPPETGDGVLRAAIRDVARPLAIVSLHGRPAVGRGGTATIGSPELPSKGAFPLLAHVPSLHPRFLGDPDFRAAYSLRYAYIAGAMANGISSVDMLAAMARTGMIGFFGSAGLGLGEIEDAIEGVLALIGDLPFGFNLIHSPADPELESATVRLYLRKRIRQVSAAAYMDLTLPLIYYRVKGIHRDAAGRVVCPNRVFAKVSRVEVARKFLSPAPDRLLDQLVERRLIGSEEAANAASVPVADALTAEADSGGHTDNRPAISLLPTMLALRDEISGEFGYDRPPFVGLGGGLSTPDSVAAAFAMGAAYVLTGSINQGCVEAGTSGVVRQMLAEADPADVAMAPAADMFEMGIRVQVLKRGTLFPMRAAKLYDLYGAHESLEALPENQRQMLERDFFRCSLADEWERTRRFFSDRDPEQITRAEADPKHKMALVFRSYLGRASTWAISGADDRKIDYQIWCGPAMGAFNQWARGSFLESPEHRQTATLAMNLMLGASIATRVNWLRAQGVALPAEAARFSPVTLSEINSLLEDA